MQPQMGFIITLQSPDQTYGPDLNLRLKLYAFLRDLASCQQCLHLGAAHSCDDSRFLRLRRVHASSEALGCRQPDSCGQSADSNRLCTNG